MWLKVLRKQRLVINPSKLKWCEIFGIRSYCKQNENITNPERTEEVSKLLEEAANFNEVDDKTWMTTPYPESADIPTMEKPREKQDPMTASVFLFPGQGTLKVGDVNKYLHLPRVKELFQIAREIIGYDILEMCQNGPQSKLNRTEHNQLATVITSLAALEQLWDENPAAISGCRALAGYSVGEITALMFSGAISLEDGIRLAGVRGAAMQAAADNEPQGMLSVFCKRESKIHLAYEEAKKWAMDTGVSEPVCETAIYIYTQTKIIGGHEQALRYIENNNKIHHLTDLHRLHVSGAFHTSLMAPAQKAVRKVLDQIEFQNPRITVYSNYTSKPYTIDTMKKLLLKQIVSPVKWEQVIQNIYSRKIGENFPNTYDLGSRGAMKIILKKINSKAAEECKVI